MVDPGTVATVANLTLALIKAWSEDDFELDSDGWGALRQFVSSAPKLIEMFGEQPDEELAARVTSLGVEAFREALRQHWAGSELAVPDRVRFWQRWSRKHARTKEIQACIQTALDDLARPAAGDEFVRPLPELFIHQPELFPLYQALLRSFHEHGRDVEPPLLNFALGERPQFDRQFRAAWKGLLTRRAGGELLRWLDEVAGDQRRDSIRELLLGQLVAWSSGHVFAAADEVPELPRMPPEDFYVEPRGRIVDRRDDEGPVIAQIEAELRDNLVVFVTADFGYGKSLTARTLAAKWARAFLEHDGVGRPPALPIYVPCGALDWAREAMDVDTLIRMAWMQQLEAITGEKLPDDDEGLTPPASGERTYVILDGLDEAHLDGSALEKLLSRIRRAASSRGRRFLLFFRPGLLSAPLVRSRGIGLLTGWVEILPFGDDEIAEWVGRWSYVANDRPLTSAALVGVRELASVPILLFMIAYEWTFGQGGVAEDRHALYAGFAATLARGKLEATGERSERIQTTAAAMAEQLTSRIALVRRADQQVATTSDEVLALLWLMGRIAWMGYTTISGPELGIAERDIDRILREELGVESGLLDFHRVSLLTCMQGRLQGDASQRYLFFGHRSFHEFFVAQFWRDTLLELASGADDEPGLVERLLEGELIPPYGRDDKALTFLLEFLDKLDPETQARIVRWAHRIAEGTTPAKPLAEHPNWPVLQLAALAVDCHLGEKPELTPVQFRAIFRAMWESGEWRPVYAPGLRVPEADLSFVMLIGARLQGCKLPKATLDHVHLQDADLRNADLWAASISNVDTEINLIDFGDGRYQLAAAGFDGACLSGAALRKINGIVLGENEPVVADGMIAEQVVFRAYMGGSFRRATFGFSVFAFVRAGTADLSDSRFRFCVFKGCEFSGALLDGATFEGCKFEDTHWPAQFAIPDGLTAAEDLSVGLNCVPPSSLIVPGGDRTGSRAPKFFED